MSVDGLRAEEGATSVLPAVIGQWQQGFRRRASL